MKEKEKKQRKENGEACFVHDIENIFVASRGALIVEWKMIE